MSGQFQNDVAPHSFDHANSNQSLVSSYMQAIGVKLLREHAEQYTPADPVYEYYTDARGKQRRRKRDVPPGLSERDAKILRKVQSRARRLDKSFNICGLRFGWTFIIGIVPGFGDVACAALNYYLVVRKASEADLPPQLIGQMMFNNAVSAFGGIVPVVGDIVIAVYKANSRNAILLEEFLRARGLENLKVQADLQVLEGSMGSSVENLTESRTGWSFGSLMSRRAKAQAAQSTGDRGQDVNLN